VSRRRSLSDVNAPVAAVADRGSPVRNKLLTRQVSPSIATPCQRKIEDFRELRSVISGEKQKANIFVRNAESVIAATLSVLLKLP
jgi:hypothetical protein